MYNPAHGQMEPRRNGWPVAFHYYYPRLFAAHLSARLQPHPATVQTYIRYSYREITSPNSAASRIRDACAIPPLILVACAGRGGFLRRMIFIYAGARTAKRETFEHSRLCFLRSASAARLLSLLFQTRRICPLFLYCGSLSLGVLTNPRWTLKKFEDSPAVFVSRGWAGFGGIGKVEIDNCYTRCPADLRPLSACSAVKIH